MTDDMVDRIFEPFYTTKGQGRGTGLGLSTVYGIIKQNNGDIDVYSEPSQGTAFKIYLPRVYETSNKESMAMFKKPMENRKCTETILLVEDDDMVRNMVNKTLSSLGYTIIEAKNGKQGETVFNAFKGAINLLLTDVVMPEQNGIELAKALQRLAPGLRVLLMSGYTENTLIRSGLTDLNTHFIQKPVTPKTISLAVGTPDEATLTAIPVQHPGGAHAFRVDWPDRTLAYVTDTLASEQAEYVEAIGGVNTLIHECYFPDGWEDKAKLTGHSCLTPVAKVAAKAKAKNLFLVHVNPLNEDKHPLDIDSVKNIFPNTVVAADHQIIDV